MPEGRQRALRVALVCGGLPADPRHLQIAAEGVDLVVHRSSWLPVGVSASSAVPPGLHIVDHRPVWRTRRGHLAFFYPSLPGALDRDRPDVVHVVSEPWGLLAVQAAHWVRRAPGSRLVLHGCDTLWHHGGFVEQWVRRRLLARTLPVTRAWAAENTKALGVARSNGLPADSLTARIHTNPRDSGMFHRPDEQTRLRARASLGLREGECAIGLLGRLVPEKGVALFLEAAKSLLAAGRPYRFFIAGAGPMLDEVERRCVPGLVSLGRLTHPHGVRQFFSALDVLACPSLTTNDWEDQGPRSVLEAMMCGCVPVATPTGALPEMLDGRGVLSARADAAALADALVEASGKAEQDEDRDSLAQWAQGRWSSAAVAEQLVTLWRAAAAQRDQASATARP